MAFWRGRHDDEALRLALLAAKHLDSAAVVAAQWYGVKGNWRDAIPLLEKAAAHGMWEAKQVLASCYLHGDGVEIDVSRGYELAADAAESGSLDCQVELTRYYSNGKLRDPNLVLARKYASMAAASGRPDVLVEIADLETKRDS